MFPDGFLQRIRTRTQIAKQAMTQQESAKRVVLAQLGQNDERDHSVDQLWPEYSHDASLFFSDFFSVVDRLLSKLWSTISNCKLSASNFFIQQVQIIKKEFTKYLS